MKIRTDFVTNSSSSSFIIAVKNGTDKETISKYIEDCIPKIEEYTKSRFRHYDDSIDKDELKDSFQRLINRVDDNGLNLGSWKVTAFEVSNDDDDLYAFIYDENLDNTDWLKTSWGWN